MRINVTSLLEKTKQVLDEECASKAADLLLAAETRLVDGAPTREEVRALLPTLQARLANSAHTGKRIYGLEQIVAKLGEMKASAVVVGYGFISPQMAGNIYLSNEGEQVLGAAIVDR